MVNIHLRKGDGQWIHALAIPLEDIGRLSLRPLKWLRYVTFTAVGAKGHLSDIPGGNVIDYENVSFADLGEDDNYYFTPEGNTPTPPTILYLQGAAKQGTTISLIPAHETVVSPHLLLLNAAPNFVMTLLCATVVVV